MPSTSHESSVPDSSAPSQDEDREAGDTASSPAPKAGQSAVGVKKCSKEDASKLLYLLLNSQFFVLARAVNEGSQIAAEACRKAVIQNLIEHVLVGVDLSLFTAGGFWGKALKKVVKKRLAQRRASAGSSEGLSPGADLISSPDSANCAPARGLDGTNIPAPFNGQRAVSGHRASDLESHSKNHQKGKFKTKGGKRRRLPTDLIDDFQAQLEAKPCKKQNEWFEIEGVVYRRDIKLNPEFLSTDSDGEMVVHLPFLTFSDPRCDEPTRDLAALLGVTDVRAWAFKLSALEGEPSGWGQPKGKQSAEVSTRGAKLLSNGCPLAKFSLEPQPICIVDNKDDNWFLIFLNKPGGFSTVADVTFSAKTEPGEECLIIKPAKGAKGPDYIVNEYFGTSPNKVLVKRKFCQLESASQQPLDQWADIHVPLPEKCLDFKAVQKKRIKNGMIVLTIKKLPSLAKETIFIDL